MTTPSDRLAAALGARYTIEREFGARCWNSDAATETGGESVHPPRAVRPDHPLKSC